MILARITQHLRRQDWTAVVLELVIVVLGVFIGLQVSDWNAAQADKRLGVRYTQRLAEDLQKDLAAHRAVLAYYGSVLESVERADALLADPRSDARQLVIHAYRASEIVNAPRTRATWDEIVSSGDTGLLPPGSLANGIADHFAGNAMRDSYDRLVESPYRHRLRSTIPLAVQKAMRAGCSDITIGSLQTIGFVEACTLDVDDQAIAATAAALRADRQLANDLRYQYSAVVSARGVIASAVLYLETAIAALGGTPVAAQAEQP